MFSCSYKYKMTNKKEIEYLINDVLTHVDIFGISCSKINCSKNGIYCIILNPDEVQIEEV